MLPITVKVLDDGAQVRQVQVSAPGGTLRMTCDCGVEDRVGYCKHKVAVIIGDRKLVLPSSSLTDASALIEQHLDVMAVLTACLDEARADPSREREVAALEYAIAQRLNRKQ